MKLVYLGLGSNIGNRAENIAAALRELPRPGFELRRVSSLYETEPIGLREQAWFVNAVAEFETILFPASCCCTFRKWSAASGGSEPS